MKKKIELSLTENELSILEQSVKEKRKELFNLYRNTSDGHIYTKLMEAESLLHKIRRQIRLFN